MTPTGTKHTTVRKPTATAPRTSRRALIGGAGSLATLSLIGAKVQQAVAQTPAAAPITAETGLLVFPRHGTRTAAPGTEISFRGEIIDQLGTVEVVGSVSGGHSGIIVPHSDGFGASFLPDAPFQPDEWVTVRAGVPLRPTPSGSVTFRVSVPNLPVKTPATREVDQPSHEPQQFQSRLDLLPPTITVTESSRNVSPGFVFVGAKVTDGQNGAMIIDNDGELVWFSPLALDVSAHSNVLVQTYLGEIVLTAWEGVSQLGTGFGHFVIWNQRYEEIARFQAPNGYPGGDQHEFRITPHGTALVIVYNPVVWDLSSVGGPEQGNALDGVIQEIDIATGRMVFEWHSLDHIALDESYSPIPENEPWDYVHINSVELDEDDNLVFSGRHTHAITRIDRTTGRVLWRLHGKHSDFVMGEGTPFFYQHDARLHPDGTLSLFDNHEPDQAADADSWSRGIVLRLNEQAKTATLVQEFVHPSEVLSISQGNMQLLPNGNAFVGWGSAPVFSEFDPDGDLVFNGRFPQGTNTYRAFRSEWVGTPVAPPDIAIERGLGSEYTVFASWNGATEVHSWIVLAGDDEDALEPIGTVLRTGFETTVTAQTAATFLAVSAHDADGNALGTSAVIPVG